MYFFFVLLNVLLRVANFQQGVKSVNFTQEFFFCLFVSRGNLTTGLYEELQRKYKM